MMRILVLVVALMVIAAVFVRLLHVQRPGLPQQANSGSATSASSSNLQKALTSGEVVDADGLPARRDSFPARKLTFLYFSANWCAPCHAFTPTLVKFYQDAGDARPFNLLMVSDDESADQLKSYADSTHMPWQFAKLKSDLAASLEHDYAGDGIPDLVLVDDSGKVLADSFNGHEYRMPQAVLDDYAKLPH